MSGMDVEELRPVAPPFSAAWWWAEIVAVAPHPGADKLRVCQGRCRRSCSPDGPLQVVCGAPNARVRHPRATRPMVGAELPPADDAHGKPINVNVGMSSVRGVDSAGMLCSAQAN